MSGVLANIYMINFDEVLNNLIKQYKGYYRRYCDDMIIVLPDNMIRNFSSFKKELEEIFNIKDEQTGDKLVILSPEKTKVYHLSPNDSIKEVSSETRPVKSISFLGFSYDGIFVRIRDKTISRYYNRMYKKMRTIKRQHGYVKKKGDDKYKKISCRNLYQMYTIKGAYCRGLNGKVVGNFITYAERARKKFSIGFAETNKTDQVCKRHLIKVRKYLKREVQWSLNVKNISKKEDPS